MEEHHARPYGQKPCERRRRALHHERKRDQNAGLDGGQPRRGDARGQRAPCAANRQRTRRQHQQRRAAQSQRQRKGAAYHHERKNARVQLPHMQKRRSEGRQQANGYENRRVGGDGYVTRVRENPVEGREHRYVHERRDGKHQRQRSERAPERRREQVAHISAAGFSMRSSGFRAGVRNLAFAVCHFLRHAPHSSMLRFSSVSRQRSVSPCDGPSLRAAPPRPRQRESAAHPKARGASYADFPAGATPGRLPPACRRDGLRPWCGRRPGP